MALGAAMPVSGRIQGVNRDRRRILRGLLALPLGVLAPAAARAAARRVISVGGAVTETVYALGAGDLLVGVDTSSIYPSQARQLPQVGYQRVLSAEGILSLRPDLLLADEGAGPPEVMQQLRGAGLAVRLVPADTTAEGVARRIRFIGEALGRETEADRLAGHVRAGLQRVRTALADRDHLPRVLLLMAHGRGSPLAAGADTSGDAMIRLAGGRNALEGFRGYKPVSAEAVVAAAPEVIVLPQQSLEALGGSQAAMATAGLSATPAAREGRVVIMDLLYLLGMGPRTADAALELARAFHPTLLLELDA